MTKWVRVTAGLCLAAGVGKDERRQCVGEADSRSANATGRTMLLTPCGRKVTMPRYCCDELLSCAGYLHGKAFHRAEGQHVVVFHVFDRDFEFHSVEPVSEVAENFLTF